MALSNEFTRARAAMLVLSAPGTREPGQKVTSVWLNGVQVSTERVLEDLTSVRKPVECSSQLADGKLLITCRRVSDRSDEDLDAERQDSTSDGILAMVIERFGDRIGLPLLLRSQFDSMIIDARDLRRWFRDYRLTGYTLSLLLEDQTATAEGALSSLVVSKPVTIIRSNLRPSDLEAP